ncbi:MAG: hypothetical protein EBZ49_13440, partial [Proteobacteria bacterium]|nr:hypothetical protein [Pseudomonadota bacterium]
MQLPEEAGFNETRPEKSRITDKEMAKSSCPVIVGVSCNPASLAKDARILVNGGYRIEAVRVIDQFLFSHHVEVVITFTKSR